MSGSIDDADHDFARRAAAYLREQGLTDDEVHTALATELELETPEVEMIMRDAA
jgi:hypothetical protein